MQHLTPTTQPTRSATAQIRSGSAGDPPTSPRHTESGEPTSDATGSGSGDVLTPPGSPLNRAMLRPQDPFSPVSGLQRSQLECFRPTPAAKYARVTPEALLRAQSHQMARDEAVRDNEVLRRHIDALQGEAHALRRKNTALTLSLRVSQAECHDLRSECDALRRAYEGSEAVVSLMREKMHEFRRAPDAPAADAREGSPIQAPAETEPDDALTCNEAL